MNSPLRNYSGLKRLSGSERDSLDTVLSTSGDFSDTNEQRNSIYVSEQTAMFGYQYKNNVGI